MISKDDQKQIVSIAEDGPHTDLLFVGIYGSIWAFKSKSRK
jgi:hypothetical protein